MATNKSNDDPPSQGPAIWDGPAFAVDRPEIVAAPLVLSSPHSGRHYPDLFLQQSRLDPLTLRRSEDAYTDLLIGGDGPPRAPTIKALFPRAFCDVNREPFELDPLMFSDRLPHYVNTRSVRVACGLGTIARVVSDGAEIYARKLDFREAEARIEACYRPYHKMLSGLINQAHTHFGEAVLLDWHSMPSIGGPTDQDMGRGRCDIVLGDRYGTAAHPHLVDFLEALFRREGYAVGRNAPYAGGHTTLLHGRPGHGFHAIQIEINRALYLDEYLIEPNPAFDQHRAAFGRIIDALSDHLHDRHQPLAAE